MDKFTFKYARKVIITRLTLGQNSSQLHSAPKNTNLIIITQKGLFINTKNFD